MLFYAHLNVCWIKKTNKTQAVCVCATANMKNCLQSINCVQVCAKITARIALRDLNKRSIQAALLPPSIK